MASPSLCVVNEPLKSSECQSVFEMSARKTEGCESLWALQQSRPRLGFHHSTKGSCNFIPDQKKPQGIKSVHCSSKVIALHGHYLQRIQRGEPERAPHHRVERLMSACRSSFRKCKLTVLPGKTLHTPRSIPGGMLIKWSK